LAFLYTVRKPMPRAIPQKDIGVYYEALYAAWGPQHWWPGRSRFEVIVGAYLTQSTSWRNVELALRGLRSAGLLNLRGVRDISLRQLEAVIRPAGYFHQKAARLKMFVALVDERYHGSLRLMFAQPTLQLRQVLLSLNGVGPETADSILLYAGQHPVFVVDAYARRILERHKIVAAGQGYEEIRQVVENALAEVPHKPPSAKFSTKRQDGDLGIRPIAHAPSPMSRAPRSPLAQLYNDMHGLIVAAGKYHCFKSMPDCSQCPLQRFLP
jgi:endonuclease III related protein